MTKITISGNAVNYEQGEMGLVEFHIKCKMVRDAIKKIREKVTENFENNPCVIIFQPNDELTVETGTVSKQRVLFGLEQIVVKTARQLCDDAALMVGNDDKRIEKYLDSIIKQAQGHSNQYN